MKAIGVVLGFIVVFSSGCRAQSNTISMEVGDLDPIEIGVLTPNKRFIFLYSDEFKCQGAEINNGHVLIQPFVAVGYYWDSRGKRHEVPVFEGVGTYKIYVSDNLETELENSKGVSMEYVVQKPMRFVGNLVVCKSA